MKRRSCSVLAAVSLVFKLQVSRLSTFLKQVEFLGNPRSVDTPLAYTAFNETKDLEDVM